MDKYIAVKVQLWSHVIPRVDITKQGTDFWHGIGMVWEEFLKQTTWSIGSGQTAEFWKDR